MRTRPFRWSTTKRRSLLRVASYSLNDNNENSYFMKTEYIYKYIHIYELLKIGVHIGQFFNFQFWAAI